MNTNANANENANENISSLKSYLAQKGTLKASGVCELSGEAKAREAQMLEALNLLGWPSYAVITCNRYTHLPNALIMEDKLGEDPNSDRDPALDITLNNLGALNFLASLEDYAKNIERFWRTHAQFKPAGELIAQNYLLYILSAYRSKGDNTKIILQAESEDIKDWGQLNIGALKELEWQKYFDSYTYVGSVLQSRQLGRVFSFEYRLWTAASLLRRFARGLRKYVLDGD